MQKSICGVRLFVLSASVVSAQTYRVHVTRIAQDVYEDKTSDTLIKTRYCYEYVYYNNAVLQQQRGGRGTIRFSNGKTCDVVNVMASGSSPDGGGNRYNFTSPGAAAVDAIGEYQAERLQDAIIEQQLQKFRAEHNANIARRLNESSDPKASATVTIPVVVESSVPMLAKAYVSAQGGNMAVMEQDGTSLNLTFVHPDGAVVGNIQLKWDAPTKRFFGGGTFNVVCGSFDTRIWAAPMSNVLVSPLHSRAIRMSYAFPTRVNCSKGLVTQPSQVDEVWTAHTQ